MTEQERIEARLELLRNIPSQEEIQKGLPKEIKVPLCIHDGKNVIGEVTMSCDGSGKIRMLPHQDIAPVIQHFSVRPPIQDGLMGKTLHISEEEDQRMIDAAVREKLGHCMRDLPTAEYLSRKHMIEGSDFAFEQLKKPKPPARNNPWYNRHR